MTTSGPRRLRPRTPLLTALALMTGFFVITGWSDLVADSSGFLDPLTTFVVVFGVGSVVLRSLHLPIWAVVLAQAYLVWVLLGTASLGLPLRQVVVPGLDVLSAHVDAVADGVRAAQEHPAPVPADVPEIHALLVAGGVGILWLVDLGAVTLRRVPLAGLPLLAAFTVPVAVLGGFPWLTFLLAATCFVLLLAGDHLSALSGWGRTFAGSRVRPEGESAPLGAGEALSRNSSLTLQIGAVALAAAVVSPLLVPTYDGLLALGSGGGGDGDGDGTRVSLDNPITDMQRDLDRGPDVDVVTVRTDDPEPSYLRVTALDRFDGKAWRPGRRDLPAEQRFSGDLPEPAGLTDPDSVPRYGYQFTATSNLRSTWLPSPFPALAATAPGDWRYDLDTRDVRSIGDDLSTAGLSWQVTAADVSPTARELVEAFTAPASLQRKYTELPWQGDPAWLSDLVDEIVAGTDSDFAAAVALQRWFRGPGGFVYSTDNADGNGTDALRTFLTEERVGYCEQFATAMALMARVHGIPARVAVGFLRPDPVGDGTYVFSTHDLHAWPELYFQGAGWVRFEPTPQDRGTVAPAYTRGQVPELQPEDDASAPTASATPTPTQTAQPDGPTTTEETRDAGVLPAVLRTLAVVLLVALLMVSPRLVRAVVRRRRLEADVATERTEAAWAELRATALDLGLGWDDRVTVRVRADALATVLRRGVVRGRLAGSEEVVEEQAAREALARLVTAVERARFSAGGVSDEVAAQAVDDAALLARALRQRVAPRTRLRATWWPVSLAGRPGAARSGLRSGRSGQRVERPGPRLDGDAAQDRDSLTL